jgi:hypothetical protein
MPPQLSQHKQQLLKRAARALATLALVAPVVSACDRLAGTNAQNIALVQKHYDSLAIADTALLQRAASQDSLFAIQEVQRRTDSIIRLTRPDLAIAAPPPDARRGAAASDTPGASPQAPAGAMRPPLPNATGSAGVSTARAPSVVPIKPEVTTDVQRRLSRAQALGDSIANAKVDKLVGQNRATTPNDSARGLVKLSTTLPGARPVLVVDGGRTTIALTGIGIDGLGTLIDAEVMVRGLRISPRDLVVSGFTVRAVKGFPVLDGRLSKGEKGGWNIELSDRSGVIKLTSIPDALGAAVGARIWIDASNGARPQTYGVIARR